MLLTFMNDENGADISVPPIASVALNKPLRRQFDYSIPELMRGRVPVGGRVRVPFGNQKSVLGYCVGLKKETDVPKNKLRPIKEVVDSEPVFTDKMLQLGRWMAQYYHCSVGEALAAAIPSAVHAKAKRRKVQCAKLMVTDREAQNIAQDIFDRSPAQSKILRTLAIMDENPPITELKAVAEVASRSSIKALQRKGFLEIEKQVVEREDPLTDLDVELEEPYELTNEQRRAYEVVIDRLHRQDFEVVLLHGITSSGKTEVYLQAIDRAVKEGEQAIVLVPEISLTPQTVRHFRSRFQRLAVLHSRLTESQRRHFWHQIRNGEADVVIGARSAIFAPVPNLGLLVIDEEHENSFKQDNVPRYHARDVGIMRARADDALVVLGTATPSLESYHNAKTGKYTAVRLRHRIGGHPLPPAEIVDMRQEWAGYRHSRVISHRLESCMRESLKKGHQVILFLNRRGHSPFIQCRQCGYTLQCDRCEITINYHRADNVVRCHYCGRERRPPDKCPECGSDKIRFGGTGTERVEKETRELFPEVEILRMDSDTMKTRDAHKKALTKFRNRQASVLVGTQMIAKGLDFPNVTTVGVVNCDVSLHLPDFRSRERTFQLLAQVAGRTGRGPAGGRVILQTYLPNDPSIRAAADHDYDRFAEKELGSRRRLRYPPFGRMARIVCRGPKLGPIKRYMNELAAELQRLCEENADGSQVLGPAAAPISKIKRRYRYHAMLKCPNSAAIHGLLAAVESILDGPSGSKVIVDVDPVSML
ncbi:MAG: primosomal protein N' [Candidatus Brocadiia bacterium]